MTTPDAGVAVLTVVAIYAICYTPHWLADRRRQVTERRKVRTQTTNGRH